MADFDPPFGQDGERRLPTTTERENGFLCGPADRELFTGLFHRIEAEIGEVIGHAGIIPTDERNTLLREAIEALIAAATGGGTAEDYILMTQARSRLPFFPEALTSDGRIAVTSPATGTVRLPGGTIFQHRGIYRATTVQTDFLTDASKTYHLRWNPTDGFTLKDLASLAYNPTAAAETSAAFDSTFDDMLVARVISNSSNVATITNLVNRDRLASRLNMQGQNWRATNRTQEKVGDFSGTLNWARTPKSSAFSVARKYSSATTTAGDSDLFIIAYGGSYLDPMLDEFPFNRYESKFSMLHDDWDITIDVVYDVSFGA